MCLKGINLHAVIIVAENRQRQGFWEVDRRLRESSATAGRFKSSLVLDRTLCWFYLFVYRCVHAV